jgi:predicted SAM-dependent methyltransferase
MEKLNFGCGRKILPGFVNLDFVDLPGVHVRHDIWVFPYPFPGEKFDYILASHVLEHIPPILGHRDGLLQVVEELHRILKSGGTLEIRVPHPSMGVYCFNNMTHYRVITPWTFEPLAIATHPSCIGYFSNIRFSRMVCEADSYQRMPLQSRTLGRLVNRFPKLGPVIGRPLELVVRLMK